MAGADTAQMMDFVRTIQAKFDLKLNSLEMVLKNYGKDPSVVKKLATYIPQSCHRMHLRR